MLEWIKDPQLRRRLQIGLSKGEAKHALTRTVHFYRLGKIRDKTFENKLYRASGLNLVVRAIILWNTVYIEKAIEYLRKTDKNYRKDLVGPRVGNVRKWQSCSVVLDLPQFLLK